MTRQWTPDAEALASRVRRQALGYAWMYEQMALTAKAWSDGLKLLSGCLGVLVGAAGLVSVWAADGAAPTWVAVVQLVLGFVIGFAAVLDTTWRLGESQWSDERARAGFALMARDIHGQLAQRRGDRPHAAEYLHAKQTEIELIKLSAGVIDARVRRAYVAKFKDDPIFGGPDDPGFFFGGPVAAPAPASAPSSDASDDAASSAGDAASSDGEASPRGDANV